MKVCSKCGNEIATKDGENECPNGCKKTRRASVSRKAKNDIMKSLGLVKVRGAMGGTYWE